MSIPLTTGRAGEIVFDRAMPGFGAGTISVLDPDRDVDVILPWVRQPAAGFWGLGELSRQELCDVYRQVDSLDTHHAFLIRRDGEPVALLQTYLPEHDPVGELYPVLPGDVGVHFLLGARGAPIAGLTTRVVRIIAEFVFSRPDAARVIVEPDHRNDRAIALIARLGFDLGPLIDLGHKQARLAVLTRDRAPIEPAAST